MAVKYTAARFMGQITLRGEAWSIEFPDADYPGWLAFYERMTERYGHKSASYASALEALRGLDVPGHPVDADRA